MSNWHCISLSGTQLLSSSEYLKPLLYLFVCIEPDYRFFCKVGFKARHLVLFLRSEDASKNGNDPAENRTLPQFWAVSAPPTGTESVLQRVLLAQVPSEVDGDFSMVTETSIQGTTGSPKAWMLRF